MFNINSLKNGDYFVAEIDGTKCNTVITFLREIGLAFKFPDHYGNNINAFWDCIGDLSWIKEHNYALVIRNFSQFLRDDDNETKKEISELLQKVVKDWSTIPNYDGEDEYRHKADFKIIYD